MNNYEEITYDNTLMAIIIRDNFTCTQTKFFSVPEFSQQVGYIVYNRGGVIKAHFHKEVKRSIVFTQEVLFIRKGKLIINFYTADKKVITSRELLKGDVVFLCRGGHGFEMIEDTEILEVKQGPYSGVDDDKEKFEGVENDTGK
ncbi:MAG: hypothetical protein C4560_08680 [Nitrospiraceae bacterium]|nr:MAG: hypothetical protein C4560_08680 [Nitrospiraceae bacterium]